MSDETIADAVSMRLASAIETLHSGGPTLTGRLFGDDWALIWATRNRIAHGYASVDHAVISATVAKDLPGFEAVLREELDRLTSGE